MEELQDLIQFLKDKGLEHQKINVDVLCGIIEYFANKQETKQCNIADVSITLPSDTDLNNYKIDLKTPLDNFYYYHRPNMVDEQPAFRESLQKALNYVKGNEC